jgi:hypothetical protein
MNWPTNPSLLKAVGGKRAFIANRALGPQNLIKTKNFLSSTKVEHLSLNLLHKRNREAVQLPCSCWDRAFEVPV